MEIFVILGIALPLVLAPFVFFVPRFLRYFFILTVVCGLLYLVYFNLTGVELGTVVIGEAVLAPISFSGHPYSRVVVLGFTLVGSMGLLYGLQLLKPSEQAVALVALASAVGIVFSDNFLVLFIFWELLTLSTSGLILLRRTPDAIMAGLYFLSFHLAGGLVFLFGILQHYQVAGTFAITEPQAGLALFIIGFGFKAAFLPLHVWVARGYPAANFAATVILSGLTTKIGVYAIARILPPYDLFIYMGASMAVIGLISAILQTNMRRLLSYSMISSLGFMVAGLGMVSNYAIDGALLHLFNSMLYKALLFMSVGAVFYATKTEDLRDLIQIDSEEKEKSKQPIWKALPLVTFGAIVGALAFSGAPLFNGYVSKYLLKMAMYDFEPIETIMLVVSIGTAALFCKLIVFGFIRGRAKIINRLPVSSQLVVTITALLCIFLGTYPNFNATFLPYGSALDHIYYTGSIWASMRLVIAGTLLFLNLSEFFKRAITLPSVFSIEYLIFKPFGNVLFNRFCQYGSVIDSSVDNFYMKTGRQLYQFCQYITAMDKGIDSAFQRSSELGRGLADRTRYLDQAIDEGYARTGDAARSLADRSRRLDESIDDGYLKTGEAMRRMADRSEGGYEEEDEDVIRRRVRFNPIEWTTKNLSFDQLILALLLGALLVVIFYTGR